MLATKSPHMLVFQCKPGTFCASHPDRIFLQASRNVKQNGFHTGDAPAVPTEQKPAGAAARAEETSSSTAVSDDPLPGSDPRSSLKAKDQGSRSAQQSSSSAAPQQAGHSGQNGLPSKQASQTADSSHRLDSRSRDEDDAAARVRHATQGSSDKVGIPLRMSMGLITLECHGVLTATWR